MSLEPTPDQLPSTEIATIAPAKAPFLRSWRLLAFQVLVVASIAAGIWVLGGDAPFPTPWNSKAATVSSRTPSASSTGTASDFFALGPTGDFRGDGPGIGKPAPDFVLATPDGDVVRLSDFRGKIVILNFWATWCVPCRKEFPELVKTYDPNSDIVVVGVDLQENAGEVRDFAAQFGATYPIVIDQDAKVADSYRLLGLPSTYFIDKEGVLRAQQFGQLTREIIDKRVAKTRAGTATP
jgi:peroxiredoxin